jgi:hypothetical protein
MHERGDRHGNSLIQTPTHTCCTNAPRKCQTSRTSYPKRQQIAKTIDSRRTSSDLLFSPRPLSICHFRFIPTKPWSVFGQIGIGTPSASVLAFRVVYPNTHPYFRRVLALPQSTCCHRPSPHSVHPWDLGYTAMGRKEVKVLILVGQMRCFSGALGESFGELMGLGVNGQGRGCGFV